MIPFELTILGTSSALPTSERYHTAHVLNVRERFFLIDCGEGTQIQMRKYGVKFSRINHIFISHLHGDHFFGLIGLLTTYVLLGRKSDLHIYAHSELPEILQSQLKFLGDDIGYNIIWHPLNFKRPQLVLENEVLTVTSFPVKHRIACCGFRFTEKPAELNIRKEKIDAYQIPLKEIYKIKKGEDFIKPEGRVIPNSELTLPAYKQRSYSFCTDTAYLPGLSEQVNKSSLLYHEATFSNADEKRAQETFHSTARQAAMLARDSNVEQLLLGHFSARYKDVGFMIEEAREVFKNTEAAREGMVIKIPQQREK
ncbi:ribonuclease Z [Roseimarinus sediminis]|uniref:ribonuclease Z n=1 Tax=Roseimarinus sediminis TaxID=1610899 RepID=UPI003D1E4DA2